jgi:riboflavin kinase/FMN adenylyltransferase
MKLIYIDDSTALSDDVAVTIGFFDGVHGGHQYLIEQLKEKARSLHLPSVVVTFDTHPKSVLQHQPVDLLNSHEERIDRLALTGVDGIYIIRFTESFSQIKTEEFMREILHNRLKTKFLLIGYDSKFGKDGTKDFNKYLEYGKTCGIQVEKAKELSHENVSIKSTFIRKNLLEGNVKEAARMLTYPYSLEGLVIAGNKIGRTIGFPTANIELTEKNKVIPQEGVYAVKVEIDKRHYQGMAYIGRRPTVLQQGEKRTEVHLFDFDEDIYGKIIRVEFIDFLRPDQAFHHIDDLHRQLEIDKKKAINCFNQNILVQLPAELRSKD